MSNKYAILRHWRIKKPDEKESRITWDIIVRWKHQMRTQTTLNADPDPSKITANRIWIAVNKWESKNFSPKPGEEPWYQDDYLLKLAEEKIAKLKIKSIRSDATLVEDVLYSASPEYFRNGSMSNEIDLEKTEEWIAITIRFIRLKYPHTLLAIVLHLDEMTPHLTAYILPAVEDYIWKRGRERPGEEKSVRYGWKLCAAELFSADTITKDKKRIPGQCSLNQTEYARFCQFEGLDLERGIENSRTTHRRMRAHYALLHQPVPAVPKLVIPHKSSFKTLGKKPSQSDDEFLKQFLGSQVQQINNAVESYAAKAFEYDNEASLRRHYQAIATQMQNMAALLNSELTSKQKKIHQLEDEFAEVTSEAQKQQRHISVRNILFGETPNTDTVKIACPSGKILQLGDGDSFWSISTAGRTKHYGAIEVVMEALGVTEGDAMIILVNGFGGSRTQQTVRAIELCYR